MVPHSSILGVTPTEGPIQTAEDGLWDSEYGRE